MVFLQNIYISSINDYMYILSLEISLLFRGNRALRLVSVTNTDPEKEFKFVPLPHIHLMTFLTGHLNFGKYLPV